LTFAVFFLFSARHLRLDIHPSLIARVSFGA
jgi:hypothetical protein